MRKSKNLFIALGLSLLLWVLNYIALIFYLYWIVSWYDILMHFLGGLTLGVVATWLLGVEYRSVKSLLIVFLMAMAVGVAWEIFEYIYGIAVTQGEKYVPDTSLDLLMDALGAVVAYLMIARSQESV